MIGFSPTDSKLFISHAYNEKSHVKERFLLDLSVESGIELWTSQQHLTDGEKIASTVANAIHECDYFINIISTLESKWNNIELLFAQAEEQKSQKQKLVQIALTDLPYLKTFSSTSGTGILFDFREDYLKTYNDFVKFVKVNSSDSLISFSLDIFSDHKPIIEVSNIVNEKLMAYYSNNPEQLKTIDRRLFEEIVAEMFSKFGYEIELTQQTRDGGRDIIAVKYAEAEVKYLIECKRPDPGNIVGIRPVRELFGVKQDEKATKAILATTSFFSKNALHFFERNKWELEPKDYNGIINWIDNYKSNKIIV